MKIKDVIGYEGLYRINENGEIFSIVGKKKLSTKDNKVKLFKNNERKDFLVSDLLKINFSVKKEFSIKNDFKLTLEEVCFLLRIYLKPFKESVYKSLVDYLVEDKNMEFKGYITANKILKSNLTLSQKTILIKLLMIEL